MKNIIIILVLLLMGVELAFACSITAGGICGGSACSDGKVCKKISDFECSCKEKKKDPDDTISKVQYTWILKKIEASDLANKKRAQGCCGNKSTGMCSYPTFKKDCTEDGYSWGKNKQCYESNKTGCMN